MKEMVLGSPDAPVELVEYPGAHHAFDSWNLETRFRATSITVRDTSPRCTIVYSRNDALRTADGEHSIETFSARKAFLRACGVRGVTVGGSLRYREDVEARVLAFADQ